MKTVFVDLKINSSNKEHNNDSPNDTPNNDDIPNDNFNDDNGRLSTSSMTIFDN